MYFNPLHAAQERWIALKIFLMSICFNKKYYYAIINIVSKHRLYDLQSCQKPELSFANICHNLS